MTPIQLTDLRRYEQVPTDDPDRYMMRYHNVSESEVLSLFTVESLLGELVKRGVLRQQRRMLPASPTERWVPFERFTTEYLRVGEPVGSVGETP